MIGGMTGVDKSVLPYTLAMGNRCYFENLNLIGLKRKGHDTKVITEYRDTIKFFFEDRSKLESVRKSQNPLVIELVDFLSKNHNKQLCVPLNYMIGLLIGDGNLPKIRKKITTKKNKIYSGKVF